MLNWTRYDSHDWANCAQTPMSRDQKACMEQLGADILQLSATDAATCWGEVHPPGRNALAIRVQPRVRHYFGGNRPPVGLKIFNLVDGKTMWPSVSRFHTSQRKLLPGLPNPQVQEVFHCATFTAADAVERGYLVQEWIEGDTLEAKLKAGLGQVEAVKLLDDLFLKLLIPLWSLGTSWWDVRSSNYVVTPRHRLMMIDSDTIGGYADEMTITPSIFTERNRGKLTAMTRYRTIIRNLVVACLRAKGGRKSAFGTERANELVATHLEPVFCAPYPVDHNWRRKAEKAYAAFRTEYKSLLDRELSAMKKDQPREKTTKTLSRNGPGRQTRKRAGNSSP